MVADDCRMASVAGPQTGRELAAFSSPINAVIRSLVASGSTGGTMNLVSTNCIRCACHRPASRASRGTSALGRRKRGILARDTARSSTWCSASSASARHLRSALRRVIARHSADVEHPEGPGRQQCACCGHVGGATSHVPRDRASCRRPMTAYVFSVSNLLPIP